MKTLSIFGLLILTLFSCQKGEVISPNNYTCNFNFEDNSQIHPRRSKYQAQIDDMTQKGGVVGVSMSVQDRTASGSAVAAKQIYTTTLT